MMQREDDGGGNERTPVVVCGSSRGLWGWNSPWAFVIESALREAMV